MKTENFNVLDIVFVGLIVSFTFFSIMRGAIKELLSLLGLIAGFFLAHWFYMDLGRQLSGVLPDPALAEVLAYLVILVVGYFAGVFLSGLGEAFRPQRNDLLNRGLGGLIGVLKGMTFSLVLYWMIKFYIPPFQDELGESMLAQELGRIYLLMEDLNLI